MVVGVEKAVGAANQFFPIEDLISAPIEAIIKAQFLAAKSTLDFVSEVGFERPKSSKDSSQLKMVEFNYTHPIPDPKNPGQVIDTPTIVKIPLLSMIQIPNLTISESTVDFNLKVVGFSQQDQKETPSQRPFKIQTSYASKGNTSTSDGQPTHTISVSIKIQKSDLSEGGQKMLSLIQESMSARSEK